MQTDTKNNKASKPVLCFFTSIYPYGRGEPFIENELNIIASRFSRVYLFHSSKNKEVRKVPENVKLVFIEPPSAKIKLTYLLKNMFLIFRLFVSELLWSRQKKLFVTKLHYNLGHIINTIYYSDKIKKCFDSKTLHNAYFYSYWFSNWNFALSILKYRNVITRNYTRAHGFDVFENNGKPNYQPYRNFCLNYTDKVFTVSKMGANYLQHIYPKHMAKISWQYLGTKYYGVNPTPENGSPIHIVSCSSIVAVKRINLIIDALKLFGSNILWTHIGSGNLEQEIIELSKKLPGNCKAHFMGILSSNQIFEFYNTVPIDVFINCSISEGLPVSIMEAISFGIPVIATNVGGCGEIVTTETGFLIDQDVNLVATANLIETIRDSNFDREQIKRFWENNFNASKNYTSFVVNLFNA